MRLEIRVAGFGGQGIIRAGLMIASAACIYGNKNALETQSYGPESRGGACKSEVVISDEEIDFPKVSNPDILLAMSQEAYNRYIDTLKEGGTLFMDSNLVVKLKETPDIRVNKIPATKIAERLGNSIVANVVMLGAFTAVTDLIESQSMEKAILDNVPKKTEKLNTSAFKKGYKYGMSLRKEEEL